MDIKDWIRYPKEQSIDKYNARRYLNRHNGQEISRRDYQTLAKGGIRPEEIARIRREGKVKEKGSQALRKHSNFVQTYKRKTALKLGIKESQVKVRGNSPEALKFRENLKKLKKFNELEQKKGIKPHMRTAEQSHKLSRILKDINFKDENDNMLPGGTYPNPRDTV